MIRRMLIAAGLCVAAASPLTAQPPVPGQPAVPGQAPVLDTRVGVYYAMPTGDLADGYNGAYGFYGRIGVPIRTFKLMAAATWTRFNAKGGVGDVDLFTVQAGPHVFLSPQSDIGLEMAYISEAKEFGISPSVSFAYNRLELMGSYTTTFAKPATSWVSVGLGLRF